MYAISASFLLSAAGASFFASYSSLAYSLLALCLIDDESRIQMFPEIVVLLVLHRRPFYVLRWEDWFWFVSQCYVAPMSLPAAQHSRTYLFVVSSFTWISFTCIWCTALWGIFFLSFLAQSFMFHLRLRFKLQVYKLSRNWKQYLVALERLKRIDLKLNMVKKLQIALAILVLIVNSKAKPVTEGIGRENSAVTGESGAILDVGNTRSRESVNSKGIKSTAEPDWIDGLVRKYLNIDASPTQSASIGSRDRWCDFPAISDSPKLLKMLFGWYCNLASSDPEPNSPNTKESVKKKEPLSSRTGGRKPSAVGRFNICLPNVPWCIYEGT